MNKQNLPIVGSYSSTKLQRKKKVINEVIVNCFTKINSQDYNRKTLH